jgi:hypothetical protein
VAIKLFVEMKIILEIIHLKWLNLRKLYGKAKYTDLVETWKPLVIQQIDKHFFFL